MTAQILFYYGLRTNEDTVDLALKMSIKGMSIEGIADVLEVQPVTVSSWFLVLQNNAKK